MLPREFQRQCAESQITLPTPRLVGAAFVSWLAKVGHDEKFSKCEKKWKLYTKNFKTEEPENRSLEEFIVEMGSDLIFINGYSDGKYVILTSKGNKWATNWGIYYEVGRGHHGHFTPRPY